MALVEIVASVLDGLDLVVTIFAAAGDVGID